MPKTILTRMGDGERVHMSSSEIRDELQKGTGNAAGTSAYSRLAGR